MRDPYDSSKHMWLLSFSFSCPDETEQKDKKPKKGGSGLTAPLPLSDALIKFLGTGESELSRGDVVKRMWEYIKENGLQVSGQAEMKLSCINLSRMVVVPFGGIPSLDQALLSSRNLILGSHSCPQTCFFLFPHYCWYKDGCCIMISFVICFLGAVSLPWIM